MTGVFPQGFEDMTLLHIGILLLVPLLVSVAVLEYLSPVPLAAPSNSLLIHLSLHLCCPVNYVVKSLIVSVFCLFLFCVGFTELPQCKNW